MEITVNKYPEKMTRRTSQLPIARSKEDLLASIKDHKFTLDGSHLIVSNFNSANRGLLSLEGAPKVIGINYFCDGNNLASLKGAPSSLPGDFSCSGNNLTSLEGAPEFIGGNLDCSNNELTSLKDIHKLVFSIGGHLNISHNRIRSHVLGLLKIKNLRSVFFDDLNVQRIINKYLPEGDIFACQQELIDGGFDKLAQL